MGRHKTRYIPYSVFHQIWDEAGKTDSKNALVDTFLGISSKRRIKFMDKYGIREDKVIELLYYIYEVRTSDFKSILKKAHKRKAEISHELCIPIDTVEGWCKGNHSCPGYTKLLILKEYGLFKLPSGIAIGNEPQQKPKTSKKKDLLVITEKERATQRKTYAEQMRELEQHKRDIESGEGYVDRLLKEKGLI